MVDPTAPDHHRDGVNIHGAYGSFKKILPRAAVEPYLLWKTGHVSIWTAGLRVAAMPGTPGLHGFDYQAEFARQWDTSPPRRTPRPPATRSSDNHRLRPLEAAPLRRIQPCLRRPESRLRPPSHFDQLLPTNHLFYGVTDPTGWQNMNMARGRGFQAPQAPAMECGLSRIVARQRARCPVHGRGRHSRKAGGGNTARRIGGEIDLRAAWAVSSQWKLGAGIGHLAAGDFLKQNSEGIGRHPYCSRNTRISDRGFADLCR